MNISIIDKRLINMEKAGIVYAIVVIVLKPEIKDPIDIIGFKMEYFMKLVPAMIGELQLNRLDNISYMPEVESIDLPYHRATTKPWDLTNY